MAQDDSSRPTRPFSSDPNPIEPSADLVVITAVTRPDEHPAETVANRGPITIPRHMVVELMTDDAEIPDLVEPAALLVPLRRVIGRAQGRSPADLVALLRLVLIAEARGQILRCS